MTYDPYGVRCLVMAMVYRAWLDRMRYTEARLWILTHGAEMLELYGFSLDCVVAYINGLPPVRRYK